MEMKRRPISGFTLLELMVAVALVAILVAIGIPSYQSLRQEQMVQAATQALYTDMMWLKSEAIKRNQDVSLIVFDSGLNSWCYRFAISSACTSCNDNNCSPLGERKGAVASDFPGVSLSTANSPISFSSRRGTMKASRIELASDQYIMRVITSNIGRVYTCAPTTSPIGGEKECPTQTP